MLILRKEQVNSMLRKEVSHMLSLGKGTVKNRLKCVNSVLTFRAKIALRTPPRVSEPPQCKINTESWELALDKAGKL